MDRRARRNPKLALAHAMDLRRLGRLEEAEQALRELLAKEPAFVEGVHFFGIVQSERGDVAGALTTMREAARLAPADLDVRANLGRVAHLAADVVTAEECLRSVIARRPDDVSTRGVLAAVLEKADRLDEAVGELRAIVDRVPSDTGALFALLRVLRQLRRHEEEVTVGHELCRLLPTDPTVRDALSRSYFLWFDAVDRDPETSRAVLARWRAVDPDDPIARHMEAARSRGGTPPTRASNEYVERHFDEFASSFDDVLVGLDYRGPKLMADALAAEGAPRGALDIVDLGCGTGAAGVAVKPWARRLVGVDLSRNMVAAARARLGVYDDVKRMEIRAYLASQPGRFDRVLCADTLPYLGDLRPLFAAARTALRPGGCLVATTEIDDAPGAAGYRLERAGRYVHDPAYVGRELERAGLTVAREIRTELRKEDGRPVEALVVTARMST